jgi:hypothetical protein
MNIHIFPINIFYGLSKSIVRIAKRQQRGIQVGDPHATINSRATILGQTRQSNTINESTDLVSLHFWRLNYA